MGRQHQKMDRPGVRQVPEGSGKQEKKLEKTGCKIFGGAPTTLAVKGLMMMMIYRSDGREMLRGRKFNDGTVDVHYQSPSSDHSERICSVIAQVVILHVSHLALIDSNDVF